MFSRLIGAVIRALLVVVVISTPAFLLPGVSVASQGNHADRRRHRRGFHIFEYASTHPGLVDFRFAPPYNRIRFFAFAAQVFLLVFLCRAVEGEDPFSIIGLADSAVGWMSFPLSPVGLAGEMIGASEGPDFVVLITRATALSLA